MSYYILDDESRNVKSEGNESCDNLNFANWYWAMKSQNWKGPGWYRLMGPAGSRIPESRQGAWHCDTAETSWISNPHPTVFEETVNVTICFNYIHGDDCRWPTEGKITNCGDFFVYYLMDTLHCSLRYCGID